MNLVLKNLQSNQQIKLNTDDPLIIGRGNVDGCSDKRVSRTHGKITCTLDGKINLLALHTNPCFFTRNGVPPVLQLNKNQEETLMEGDCIGLLPNAFWFQITSNQNAQQIIDKLPKIKCEVISDVDEINSVVSDDDNVNKNCDLNKFHKNQTSDRNFIRDEENDPGPSNDSKNKVIGISPQLEKTRKLPLWMYKIQEPVKTKGSSAKRPVQNSTIKSSNKKTKTSSDVENQPKPSENSTVKVKEEITILDIPSTSKISDEILVPSDEEDDKNKTVELSEKESTSKNQKKEDDCRNEDVLAASQIRPICQYEANCYRKNPQHKLDFCHPGDADYIPYENRPVCPYGSKCYRQNTKHKVEFRHSAPSTSKKRTSRSPSPCESLASSSSPLPAKRKRKTVKKQNDDYEEEDEYDLEDPFINDATSDEYVPSSSEEDLDTSLQDD